MANNSRKLICPKCYRSCRVTTKMLLICGYCNEIMVYAPRYEDKISDPLQVLADLKKNDKD